MIIGEREFNFKDLKIHAEKNESLIINSFCRNVEQQKRRLGAVFNYFESNTSMEAKSEKKKLNSVQSYSKIQDFFIKPVEILSNIMMYLITIFKHVVEMIVGMLKTHVIVSFSRLKKAKSHIEYMLAKYKTIFKKVEVQQDDECIINLSNFEMTLETRMFDFKEVRRIFEDMRG